MAHHSNEKKNISETKCYYGGRNRIKYHTQNSSYDLSPTNIVSYDELITIISHLDFLIGID